jgi:glutathione S-transferase
MANVELAAARALNQPVLVLLSTFPSPWGESAKGLFRIKKLQTPILRARANDAELIAWIGIKNLPALMVPGEPTHSSSAELITAAERLGGVKLVPADPEARVRMFGLVHELAGEWGVGWCSRLLMIHASNESGGVRGFPAPSAGFLSPRYGYSPALVPEAKARVRQVLGLFAKQLGGSPYVLGTELTAVDVYLACFLTLIIGVSETECPGLKPQLYGAFKVLGEEVGDALTPALREHHARMFREHLEWPIRL